MEERCADVSARPMREVPRGTMPEAGPARLRRATAEATPSSSTRDPKRATFHVDHLRTSPASRSTWNPIGRPTPAGSRRAATARRPVSCGGRHRLSPPHPGRDHRRQRPLRVTSVRSHASRGSVWAPFPDRGANRTGPDGGGGTAHTRGAGHSAASGPAYEAATSDTGPGVAAVSSVPTPRPQAPRRSNASTRRTTTVSTAGWIVAGRLPSVRIGRYLAHPRARQYPASRRTSVRIIRLASHNRGPHLPRHRSTASIWAHRRRSKGRQGTVRRYRWPVILRRPGAPSGRPVRLTPLRSTRRARVRPGHHLVDVPAAANASGAMVSSASGDLLAQSHLAPHSAAGYPAMRERAARWRQERQGDLGPVPHAPSASSGAHPRRTGGGPRRGPPPPNPALPGECVGSGHLTRWVERTRNRPPRCRRPGPGPSRPRPHVSRARFHVEPGHDVTPGIYPRSRSRALVPSFSRAR
jgi:hypothetical protein